MGLHKRLLPNLVAVAADGSKPRILRPVGRLIRINPNDPDL
jgi:hypothetical protein